MGRFDSSLTRVQPVFNELYLKDKAGESWIEPLLKLASDSKSSLDGLTLHNLVEAPIFELSAHPPKSFLRWLISNPEKLSSPPEKFWEKWGSATRNKRKVFLKGDKNVQIEALKELDNCQNIPDRTWWRLEGVTKVDCALRTSNAIIFIEGKRTERGASKDILWYPNRNQVLRNLDCASEYTKNHGLKYFFVMIVVEKDLFENDHYRQEEVKNIVNPQTVKDSFPHLSEEEQKRLMNHYLGVTTWQNIVAKFNLREEILIDDVDSKQ